MSKFSEVVVLPTIEEAIDRACEYEFTSVDGRDAIRLAQFLTSDKLHLVGVEVKEDAVHIHNEWNIQNVELQVKTDVEFAFDKALGKRGISASCMNSVLEMWHRILRPDFKIPEYEQYGLPMCKAMAVYYGFDNPIGEDEGNEYKYSAESDY